MRTCPESRMPTRMVVTKDVEREGVRVHALITHGREQAQRDRQSGRQDHAIKLDILQRDASERRDRWLKAQAFLHNLLLQTLGVFAEGLPLLGMREQERQGRAQSQTGRV